jgi:hypothetical protein
MNGLKSVKKTFDDNCKTGDCYGICFVWEVILEVVI